MRHGFFDSSIPELLRLDPGFVQGFDCVVTCLDSGRNTFEILVALLDKERVRRLGQFGIISGEVAVAMSEELFVGFDEIYVVDSVAFVEPGPSLFATTFTSERVKFTSLPPEGFIQVMKEARAIKYASDGVGLNVAIWSDYDEMARLESHLGG